MATIETKYSIDDIVYSASIKMEQRQHDCPDCIGARKWHTTSPAGVEYTFPCPRCSSSYNSYNDLSLKYPVWKPVVERRTIGQIEAVTGRETRYMCRETGVGSGNVYDENKLLETEEEAMTVAVLMANEKNKTDDYIVKTYNKVLSVGDYQLESARLKEAEQSIAKSRAVLYGLGDLFSNIEEASDKEEILDLVGNYREYDWKRDKERCDK